MLYCEWIFQIKMSALHHLQTSVNLKITLFVSTPMDHMFVTAWTAHTSNRRIPPALVCNIKLINFSHLLKKLFPLTFFFFFKFLIRVVHTQYIHLGVFIQLNIVLWIGVLIVLIFVSVSVCFFSFLFTDANECILKTAKCPANSQCINLDPGYACRCSSGYQKNGSLCQGLFTI